jgi:hypothetical protein
MEILQILNEKLLAASTQSGLELFYGIVNAIKESTNSCACSLWVINNNKTDGNDGCKYASLLVREMEQGLIYPTNNSEDYSHNLDDCFIQYVLSKTSIGDNMYYECPISECKKHKSIEALRELKIQQ